MMKSRASLLAAIAVAFGIGGGVALAQDVPTLDVGPLCRAEAKAAPSLAGPCMDDQKRAREDLVRQWSQFTPAERRSCLELVNTVPGTQSYIELLTCLQMRRDVRTLPKQ
jgi:hypothetical protein